MSLGRPAMRQRERRKVQQNLSMHAEIMAKLEAAGYTREKASSLALEVMKGKRDLTTLLEVKR